MEQKPSKLRLSLIGCGLALMGVVGCSHDNPLRESAQGIAAAAATARSASLAMDAIAGTVAGCVQVTAACTTYPCSGAATVDVGGCGYPLSVASSGTVHVTGQWTSVTDATLSAQFVDVREAVSNDAIALVQVTSIRATRSSDTVTVSYSGSTADARSGLSSVAVGGANSWMVQVATQGTADPADDVLTVDASSAAAGAGVGVSAKTTSLSGVTIDPSCAKNPIAGSGQITEVQTFIPKIQNISFHAACDGKGTVNGDSYDFDVTP